MMGDVAEDAYRAAMQEASGEDAEDMEMATQEEKIELFKEVQGLITDIGDEALTDWQRTFFADFEKRVETYGDKTFMSEKQMIQMKKIKDLF